MNRVGVALVAAVLAATAGCASPARYIEKTGDVGVVAIPANTDAWPTHYRREALTLIEKHVGPGYEIVEEKEVVVGASTNNNQQVNREKTINTTIPFLPAEKETINNTTTTHDITEWRIAYRRRADAPIVGTGSGLTPAGATVQTRYPPGGGTPGVIPAGGPLPPGQPARPVIPAGGADCKQ